MVFERIVVEVLNRFLGDYVENLNKSQLKLGIWGGDVVLENLVLKQTALEELQIPVQAIYGRLGKLTLKIPWKNLYGESVEATVDRLFLVVNPNAEVKYDREREEANAFAAKKAELARVEEAKKLESLKENKMDETFVEKLVTQIIKNVQLKITDIHVRYEDSITNPMQPFSLGFTLHNLSVHTTDENWRQTVVQEAVTKIFKILSLEGLAIYWNTSTDLYTKWDTKMIENKLHSEIATKNTQPASYYYVLGPINATAKLKLNTKPELDTPSFSIPKVLVSLHMEQLSVSLTKSQYRDMMLLADTFDRMSKGLPYRKYRPNLKSYKGHYKEWWHFAYKCIVEEEVRRRRNNWDWKHMLAHRTLCKDYASAYQAFLTNRKATTEQQKILDKAEKHLDLLNLVVIRQRIEMEVERLGKLEEEARKSQSWFGSWWYGGNKGKELSEQTDLLKEFQNAMTPEEKEKLFRAIGYQENSAPAHLPIEYVAMESRFRLDRLLLTLTAERPVLAAAVDGVHIAVSQRPSASAMRVAVDMHEFTISGVKQGNHEPRLVLSKEVTENVNLLNVVFETNPIDKSGDQKLQLIARPLQIMYDAQTVIQIIDVFKPPEESTALTVLQEAAGNKLTDLKEKSALGMQYALSQHTFIDLDVRIASSYLVVPQGGVFRGIEQCVVVKLGAITVKSTPRAPKLDVARLYREGMDDDSVLSEIAKRSYDKITVGFTEMQVVIAKKEEDWQKAISSTEGTHMHLLQPTNLVVQIHRCLIDDPRLPKVRIMGQLEKIAISISQDRLLTFFEIIIGMPLPRTPESISLKAAESKGSSLSLLRYLDPAEKQKRDSKTDKRKQNEPSVQLTEVEAFFVMKELVVTVNRQKQDLLEPYTKFLHFSLNSLELTVTQKTWKLDAMVRLESINLSHHRVGHSPLYMITTPHAFQNEEREEEEEEAAPTKYWFTITYCAVDKKCPEFRSVYGSVEQLIELYFTELKIVLHLECLREILVVVNEYQVRMEDIENSRDRVADAGPLATIMEGEELAISKSKTHILKTSDKKTVESIQLKVQAKIATIEIEFATEARPLALIALAGAKAGLVVKASYTQLEFNITAINVKDLNPNTIHHDILKVLGGDVIDVNLVTFNKEQFPHVSDVDMAVVAQLNTLRIVFLNWFVSSMLEFLDNFQTAQQAIIEASSQAADAARERATQAYQNATKMRLNIRMAAPLIIVPENSRSTRALLIDLGRLSISNRFVDIEIPDIGKKVTVDELTLDLEDMKSSCGDLGEEQETKHRVLLQPITFRLLVKRSLSEWYAAIPNLELSGRIHTITVSIADDAYQSIMKILNQNLTEGQKKEQPRPKTYQTQQSVTKTSKITRSQIGRLSTKSQANVETPVEENKEEDKPAKINTKFSFTMESFVINLSTTSLRHDTEETIVLETNLARLTLTLISVKGRMFSDGSMHASMLLVDCTLDDTRPNRGDKITRYLERRKDRGPSTSDTTTETGRRSMVDITYTTRFGDTFIDFRTFSFNLILAMDFMNRLTEFMRIGIEPISGIEAAAPEKLQERKSITAMQQKKTTVSTTSEVVMSELEPERESITTINIKIEQPDIILVESLEQKKCDALVLSMEVRLKVRQSGARLVVDGGISRLQVLVRALDAHGLGGAGGRTLRTLLAPAHVSLAVAQPPNSGMHVDISVTDIKITVSPAIIALVNRVLATMSSTEEQSTETVQKAIVYHELWAIRELKPYAYWYLKVDEAQEAIDMELEEQAAALKPPPPVGEICLLSSPSIEVSFEMEIGTETIPVLVMEASLTAQVKDWSSEMLMESTWSMQVSYYNMERAEWEPLLEPVERMIDTRYVHRPWELNMEMVIRPVEPPSIDSTDEAANALAVARRQANKTITLSSNEPLELTFTSTGLEVLGNLANAFTVAADETASKKKGEDEGTEEQKKSFGAPYVLHNNTGLTVQLYLADNKDFTVYLDDNKESKYKEVVLEPGASVPLQLRRGRLCLKLNEPPPPLKLVVRIVEMEEELQIPVERSDKRYFALGRGRQSPPPVGGARAGGEAPTPHVAATEPRGLISDIIVHDAAMQIYLRSVVQVTNNLSVNLSVYHMTRSGNEVRLLGDVAPGGIVRLPLQAVYTPTAEIFFSVEGFTVSASPFVWRRLSQEPKITTLLYCDSKDKNSGEKFYMKAVGTMEQVCFENTNRFTFASCCYDIVLKPSVKMQNCLPVSILVSQLGVHRTQLFQPGEMFHLSCLAPNKASVVVMIENYLDKCWVCTKNLPDEETELSVWSFESHDSPALMVLDLGMHSMDQDGTQVVSIYCPFWMLNKTGFTLSYRKSKKPEKDAGSPLKNADECGNVIFHPKDYKEPILFSFRAKNFFGKKKAAIRLEFGEWSDKFSLDVPGSSGVVICKLEGRSYQVAVTNQLTFNSLTKMVIFTPFFVIINEAPFDIQYQEMHRPADPWKTVESNSSAPLWPMVEKEEKLLLLRAANALERCAPFLYTEQHSTCLKLDNSYGGLHVDVALTEGGTYITVQQYRDGHAPALLVNYSPYNVTVYEKENVNVRVLPSMHEMLYSWDNPAGPQKLIFEGMKRKEHEVEIRQDGIGDFMVSENQHVYWVSFLDGMQRVVLITEDPLLASGAHTVGEAELVDTELILSMYGLGVSLVNDQRMQEIVYVSISNSGIIWEQCKIGGQRYKKLDHAKLILFEEAYQHFLREKLVSDTPVNPVVIIDEKIEVNFEEMRQLRPNHRLLRRVQEPGLWASYGTSPHQVRMYARLLRLQVDQQLPAATFPVVLAPVPPPRSVVHQGTGMKPFIEVSIVKRIMEHSKVQQYKYFKVLIQEFHVKVDMGLINALMDVFPQRVLTEKEALEAFQEDVNKVNQPLESLAAMEVAQDQKNFYDNLHLSPLKVHVSFSLGGATSLPTFVGTLLQSIGVTLTDMNDVIFKLSYYERNYEFLSQKELVAQVKDHYMGQGLKQMYVLVLGLDVIGNPYGLVIGLKKGVEDLFYEPFQGAIQGPGEFAEGLFLGVRSLVGHTVGGAAGAMSRITGAMGHGIAALSLDKDYQRRRRDNMNKPPANLQEGLARSGKGLVMSVVQAVAGVVVNPIRGAQDAGLLGFLKGTGRGAIGIVMRPVVGTTDFFAMIFSTIERVADLSEEVTKQRPARYLPPETGVRPYSRAKAEGYKLLYELEKGKYVTTDSYEAHVWVIPDKEAILCTDKRILYVEKNAVFGGWQIMWTYLWSELPEKPSMVNKGIYIPVPKKKVFGMFSGGGAAGKVVFLYDEQLRKYLLAECSRLLAASQGSTTPPEIAN